MNQHALPGGTERRTNILAGKFKGTQMGTEAASSWLQPRLGLGALHSGPLFTHSTRAKMPTPSANSRSLQFIDVLAGLLRTPRQGSPTQQISPRTRVRERYNSVWSTLCWERVRA